LVRPRVERWVSSHAEPLVFYFHSWEMEAGQPRIAAATLLQRLRHYRNLEHMPGRIRSYLARYAFTSVADHLGLAPAAVERLEEEGPAVRTAGRGGVPAAAARVRLSLVIPCFNEAETLRYLQKTLRRFAEKSAPLFDLDYVLVDDGSSDATWELLRAYFGGQQGFKLVRHERNQGIAAALITGFRHARGDYVAALDADCTFAPEQLLEMMAMMTDAVDVVVASPAHAQGVMQAVPAWRSLLSRGAAFLHRCVFRSKLTSYTSCFRIYRRNVLQNIAAYDPGFCGVTEILGRLDLAGCTIVEFPAVLETRLLGRSKIKVVRTMAGHLKLAVRLARLRWLGRPLPLPAAEMKISYADNDRT
ncbi:MAG: glycosyltransferase, partial [Kiloniellaceae bacterium]